MAAERLGDVMRQADELSLDEMLALASYLLDKAGHRCTPPTQGRRWRDLHGLAPYPLAGADAQVWVSESRRQSDAGRSRQA